MPAKKLTILELRNMILEKESADPLVLLEGFAQGIDVRSTSSLLEVVDEIDDNSEYGVDQEDWDRLKKLVRVEFKYEPVSLSHSLKAATTLAEYLHAKKKQETLGINDNPGSSEIHLTAHDVELLKEIFDRDY